MLSLGAIGTQRTRCVSNSPFRKAYPQCFVHNLRGWGTQMSPPRMCRCTSVMEAMHAYAHRKDAQSQSSVRAHSSNAGWRFDRHRFSRALRCVGTDSQALRRRTEQRPARIGDDRASVDEFGKSCHQEEPHALRNCNFLTAVTEIYETCPPRTVALRTRGRHRMMPAGGSVLRCHCAPANIGGV